MDAQRLKQPKYSVRGNGPFLGYTANVGFAGTELIRIYANEPGHLITVAPTRAGKGRCHIIPNLLTWPGSAIVLDVKSEIHAETSGYRANGLGQNILKFAPFELQSCRWNPLDPILALAKSKYDANSTPEKVRHLEAEMQDAVSLLIELMFTPPPGGPREPFWQNAAKSIVQGIVLYVCTAGMGDEPQDDSKSYSVRTRTMEEMRRLLTLEPDDFNALLEEMKDSRELWVRESASFAKTNIKSAEQWVGVLSEAIVQTRIWSNERVKWVTGATDGAFTKIREKTTLYICIPPEHLNEYRALFRVLVGTLLNELKKSHSGRRNETPVLVVLDEFPQLHNMKPVEDAVSYMAGYGVKMWFFVQDLGQLQHHYPTTWRSIFANCGVQMFFGVNDHETAKLVSDMTGQTTISNETRGTSHARAEAEGTSNTSSASDTSGGLFSGVQPTSTRGTSQGVSRTLTFTEGSNYSQTNVGRALITPDEVMRLNPEQQIIFMRGHKPILADLLLYDRNKLLKGRCLPVATKQIYEIPDEPVKTPVSEILVSDAQDLEI